MTAQTLAQTTEDLVHANRILMRKGVLDAYGHVSVRHPEDPRRFLLSRNLAPLFVSTADIQVHDLEGATDDPRPGYSERFIHSELYRARPDVHSVVHSHSVSVVPFSVVDRPLRALWHMAAHLGDGLPVYDSRGAVDGENLLVTSRSMGADLADVVTARVR
ncbi:class II aldolase/adducin family protein [Microbacterium album]|nr:class II aldolase/adducin family protein [Microbacterium album]